MLKRDIVVMGASAGGLGLFRMILSTLPKDLKASIFIVWHMGSEGGTMFSEILNRASALPVAAAIDNEPIKPGRVYVAPPDRHMILEKNRVRVAYGPKENRFRPAIDPLFRSAAALFGPRVTAVLLSGGLDDGSAGLYSVKKMGGAVIVQDPQTASHPSMPANALRVVKADYVVPAEEISSILTDLVTQTPENLKQATVEEKEKIDLEVRIASGEAVAKENITGLGPFSVYTCPECGGTLSEIKEANFKRYRCHTGHAFSALTLLNALNETIENSLWSTMRVIEESIFLLNQMGHDAVVEGKEDEAKQYFDQAKEAEKTRATIRNTILQSS